MHQLIEARYGPTRAGLVDEVTLDQLIASKRIRSFYRPSEQRWIDVTVGPVRRSGTQRPTAFSRRASDRPEHEQRNNDSGKEKPHGILSSIFRRHTLHASPDTTLTSRDWFERGLWEWRTTDNCAEAVRAFALSITLDPGCAQAFVNRGMVYESLGNLEQAIDDFSEALRINPSNGMVYYLRGLALRRTGREEEALSDLKMAAHLHYGPALSYLKSPEMFQ